MRKSIKFLLTIITVLIFIFIVDTFKVNAIENDDDKIYCEATLDDNFLDDTIIIVLNKKATFSFKEYTNNDFWELGEVIIDEITKESTAIVKNKYLYNLETDGHSVKISEEYRRIYKITLKNKGKQNVLNAIKKLECRDDIKSAEPNYIINVTTDSMPQDYINYGTDCCPSDSDPKKWWIDRIGLDKVWDLNLNSKTVDVAVFDTGVDFSHPDLVGKQSSIPGKTYFDGYPEDEDMIGHGTAVASVICGSQNNGGMLGVFDNVKIVSYRMSLNNYYPDDTILLKLLDGLQDVSNKGIRIINFCGGGNGGTNDKHASFKQALMNYDGLFICTAGNNGQDNDKGDKVIKRFPSNVDASNLIAVGASCTNDEIFYKSNVGINSVDLFAPGVCIYSAVPIEICENAITSPNNIKSCEERDDHCIHSYNGYHYSTGTSLATPIVTGSAAIIYSLLDELPNISFNYRSDFEIIKNILLDTVDTHNISGGQPFSGKCVSGGRLNVFNAVKYVLTNYGINTMYSLNNNTNLVNINKYIYGNSTSFTNTNGLYKLNVTNSNYYEFKVDATNAIDVILYNEDFNEIEYNDLDSLSNKVEFLKYLSTGTYYLRTKFSDSSSSGNISICINYIPNLNQGNNNILTGYTNGVEDYVYTNNNSAGFYKLTLNATNSSGTIEYPEGCIKVFADEAKQQMLARLETIFYTLDAETQGDSDNLIVFLEYGQSYYINIDLPNGAYSSMNINIERLTNTYDIVTNNAEEHVILDENTTAYGDYIQRVEIHEAGTYTITFTHEGPQSEENLSGQEDPLYLYYAFYKEVYSPAEQFGDLEMIFPHAASSMGGTISFTFNLQPGVYYIGYYNKLNNEPMSISITS